MILAMLKPALPGLVREYLPLLEAYVAKEEQEQLESGKLQEGEKLGIAIVPQANAPKVYLVAIVKITQVGIMPHEILASFKSNDTEQVVEMIKTLAAKL